MGKVSAEMELHRAIVQCTGAGAVLHTHSQAATLLSLAANPNGTIAHLVIEGLEMLKGLEGIQTHECQVQIPVLANDQNLQRLSDRARPHLQEAPHGLLIAGHGLYAWGADLQLAMRHLEILNRLAGQYQLCWQPKECLL